MKKSKKIFIGLLGIIAITAILGFSLTACSDAPNENQKAYWNITWNLNGGNWAAGSSHPTKVEKGTALSEPTPAPTRNDFTFKGWYTNSELTSSYNFSSPVTGNLTLYAGWQEGSTPIEYWQIDWELNGGEWAAGFTPITQVIKGETLSEPTEPTNGAYFFKGWHTDEELLESYNFSEPVIGNLKLYAGWQENPVEYWQITWNLNDGSWPSGYTPPAHVVKGEILSEPTTHPTKGGHTFDGWYTNIQLTASYDFNSNVTSDLTLYAAWQPEAVEYWNITWNLNDGSWSSGYTPPAQVVKGEILSEPVNPPTKQGHTFGGWYSNSGLTTSYDFNSNVTSDLTLYAAWQPVSVEYWNITWHLNDGSWSSGYTPPAQVVKGEILSEPANPPIRQGYIFNGWYTNSGLTTSYNFANNVTAAMDLYAAWKEVVYNYTITGSGASFSVTGGGLSTAATGTMVQVLTAIREDANGEDVTIEFDALNTTATATFSGSGWGEIILAGNITGTANVVLAIADAVNVTIDSSTITQISTSNNADARAITIADTASVTIIDGTLSLLNGANVSTNGRVIYSSTAGASIHLSGTTKITGGAASIYRTYAAAVLSVDSTFAPDPSNATFILSYGGGGAPGVGAVLVTGGAAFVDNFTVTNAGVNISADGNNLVNRPVLTALTVNPAEVELDMADNTTKTLTASPYPQGALLPAAATISWVSDKPLVADVAVTDGVVTVTAVDEGTATITATVDGTQIQGTCEVTVVAEMPDPISSVTISYDGVEGEFVATDNDDSDAEFARDEDLAKVVAAIRAAAQEEAVTITFDNLSIGNATVALNNNSGKWGVITLEGQLSAKNTNANEGAVTISTDVSVNIKATITDADTTAPITSNANNRAVYIDTTGGTVEFKTGAVITSNLGPAVYATSTDATTANGTVLISDGVFTSKDVSTQGNEVPGTIYCGNNASLTIAGGTITNSAAGFGVYMNNASGSADARLNLSGGTVTAGGARSVSVVTNTKIYFSGTGPTLNKPIYFSNGSNTTWRAVVVGNPGVDLAGKSYTINIGGTLPTVNSNRVIIENGVAFKDRFTVYGGSPPATTACALRDGDTGDLIR